MADVSGRQDADCSDRVKEEAITRLPDRMPALAIGRRTSCLSLATSVYSLRSVLAAAYKLSSRFAVFVDSDGEGRLAAFLISSDEARVSDDLTAFVKELADQQLRAVLEAEFGALRTLVVAQAFSEGNLLDPDRETADDETDNRGTRLRR
ncbi:MAG: His-Xaa-Ser system protein HxsD [Vicinamibacterales bacterium]|jgi:His-Xaa-Ser system protein HxsD